MMKTVKRLMFYSADWKLIEYRIKNTLAIETMAGMKLYLMLQTSLHKSAPKRFDINLIAAQQQPQLDRLGGNRK